MLLGVRPWEPWAQPAGVSPVAGPVGSVIGPVAKVMATYKPIFLYGSVTVLSTDPEPRAWVQIPALLVSSSPVAFCTSVSETIVEDNNNPYANGRYAESTFFFFFFP